MLIYTDSQPSRFLHGAARLLPQQPRRRGGGGRPDGTERWQGCSELPTGGAFFFLFKCVFRLFICCSRCVMIVIWSRRHVRRRLGGALREEHRVSAMDGRRRRHTESQSMLLAEAKGGKTKKKRRPAVAGAQGGRSAAESAERQREVGLNDAETQRERRHFAAGDFQS